MADARDQTRTELPTLAAARPKRMRLRLDATGLSDIGKVRETNEDSFVVCHLARTLERLVTNLPDDLLAPRIEEGGTVLMVADGMGGMAAGEVASRTTIVTALQLIFDAPKWALKLDDPATREAEIQQMWARGRGYLERIHATVRRAAHDDPNLKGMGTTLTSAFTTGTDLFLMHIGDSRAYLHAEGRLQQITRDQTLSQNYIDMGLLSESDPAARRLRHVLTQAIGGSDDELQAELHAMRVAPGDRLLLCTDGLTNVVDDDELTEVLGGSASSADACRTLIELALEYGAPDNVTAVVASWSAES